MTTRKKKQVRMTQQSKPLDLSSSPHPIYTELVEALGVNPREAWSPKPLPSQQMGEK